MVLRLRGTKVTALQGNMSLQDNRQLKLSPACTPPEIRVMIHGMIREFGWLSPKILVQHLTCSSQRHNSNWWSWLANAPPMLEAHKNLPFVFAWTLKVNLIPDKLSYLYFPDQLSFTSQLSTSFFQQIPAYSSPISIHICPVPATFFLLLPQKHLIPIHCPAHNSNTSLN